MKKLLSALLCAAAVLSVSCGSGVVGNPNPVFVGTSYAAEDEGHVYFLDVSDGLWDKRIYILDRGSSVTALSHGYSDSEAYYVSSVDGAFKYVDSSGNYGVVQ